MPAVVAMVTGLPLGKKLKAFRGYKLQLAVLEVFVCDWPYSDFYIKSCFRLVIPKNFTNISTNVTTFFILNSITYNIVQ